MSASVVDILRGAGFVPVVPELSRQPAAPESKLASRVPVVPVVPAEKYTGESETAKPSNPDTMRVHLLALSAAEYRDLALVHALPESEFRAYAEHFATFADPIPAMRALLSMLADEADRRALRRPKDDTAAILCRKCGPVWVHPSIAAALPVVNGWPRSIGCPWCLIHPTGGMNIPRPHVTCAECQHFQPDSVNPAEGMGRCGAGRPGTTYPHQAGQCKGFEPRAKP